VSLAGDRLASATGPLRGGDPDRPRAGRAKPEAEETQPRAGAPGTGERRAGDPTGDPTGDPVAEPTPDPAADEEDHYHPPPPPPLPRPSRRTTLGIVLIGLGVLLLFGPRLLGVDAGTGFTVGVLAILAGGTVLVLGLRDSRSDDGPDDGAVV